MTLRGLRGLWDADAGGFFRYADGSDWTRPGTGKTLEDNAALLQVYVEAAQRLRHAEWLEQASKKLSAGSRMRWLTPRTADSSTQRRLAGEIGQCTSIRTR